MPNRGMFPISGSAEPLREADRWLDRFRKFWTPPLHALETELRGSSW